MAEWVGARVFKSVSVLQLKEYLRNDMELIVQMRREELKKLDFAWNLPLVGDVLAKEYKRSFRGKQDKEKDIMYRKHKAILTYLSIVKLPGIVPYQAITETDQYKQFTFVMSKAQHAFVSFSEGYRFFHGFKLPGKLEYIVGVCQGLISLEAYGILHSDITFRNTVVLDGKVCLIDFDMARILPRPHTEPESTNSAQLSVLRKEMEETSK